MKYSVILPIHNERGAIESLLGEIRTAMDGLDGSYEIVAVDDGSYDGTPGVLERCQAKMPELRIITLRRNFGQTAALSAGFDRAHGEVLVTLDSDGQNNPKDIPDLVAKLDEGYDCVMGWREKRRDSWFLRKLPSMIANRMIRRLWGTELKDFGCGLKVLRREILKDLSFYGEMHRILALLLIGAGAKVVSVPVDHRARTTGRSKYGLERTFKLVLDLTTVWFLDHFQSKPIHIFGTLGLGCFVGGTFCGAIAIAQKLITEFSLNRNPLFFMAIFLGVAGIQFIGTGLISELLSRIYFESTARRPYTVQSDRAGKAPGRSVRKAS